MRIFKNEIMRRQIIHLLSMHTFSIPSLYFKVNVQNLQMCLLYLHKFNVMKKLNLAKYYTHCAGNLVLCAGVFERTVRHYIK